MTNTMLATRSYKDQILDCFLSQRYGLVHLLELMDIVESGEVPTAAVESTGNPRLLVNPDFARLNAETPEKLFMLVMHELHHVLLGHTRQGSSDPAIDNIVFDAVINALLCMMFPQPEYTALFTDYYDPHKFPQCLLRPPAQWNPREPLRLPPALRGAQRRPAAEVYRALYSDRGVSYEELRNELERTLSQADVREVQLLGSHLDRPAGDGGCDAAAAEASLGLGIVRHVARSWPRRLEVLPWRGLKELLETEPVEPTRPASTRSLLRGLLRQVAGLGQGGCHRHEEEDSWQVQTPIPAADRRSIVQRAMGMMPILFTATVPHRTQRMAGERVHVYVDVSGSIGDLKGALYGAILDCQSFVHPVVHAFSTKVAELSLNQLREGLCPTTGGTSIDCVAANMQKNRVWRAVLLTDGYVGRPRRSLQKVLRRARLGVALLPGSSSRDDLAPYADHWLQLRDMTATPVRGATTACGAEVSGGKQ